MLVRLVMVLQLFWVYARGVHRITGNHQTWDVRAQEASSRFTRAGVRHVWSTLVLRDSQSGYLRPPGITDENVLDAKAWNHSTSHLHYKVIGLMLAEAWHTPTMMDLLSERDRSLKDYRDLASRHDGDLLKFRVVEAIAFQRPRRIWLENSCGAAP